MSSQPLMPTVIVENGDHAHVSRGDGVMLKAALRQLRARWPQATLGVVSSSKTRLRLLGERAALLKEGRPDLWRLPDDVLLARTVPTRVLDLWWTATRGRPVGPRMRSTARRACSRAGFLREPLGGLRSRLEATRLNPDLTLAAGGGYFCDMDADRALSVLDTLEWAQRRGSVTALVSQGVGPIEDGVLLGRMAEVLPAVDRIFLREGLIGPEILRQIGVAPERFQVAGDDAILLSAPPLDVDQRRCIGVSLRSANYLGLDEGSRGWLAQQIAEAARALGAPLKPITACEWGDEDRKPNRAVCAAAWESERDLARSAPPEAFPEAVLNCRVVVTTTYHAAVFALSQGLPAVCIYRTDYQGAKLRGLADLYHGSGITLVEVASSGPRPSLSHAIMSAWYSAEDTLPALGPRTAYLRASIAAAYNDIAGLTEARLASRRLPDSTKTSHIGQRPTELATRRTADFSEQSQTHRGLLNRLGQRAP
jgi:polysaccharide pyruvyl transferase WcaK-like protein